MSDIREYKENDGRTRYEVEGSDGWKVVTHSFEIARREAAKPKYFRRYGENRVTH